MKISKVNQADGKGQNIRERKRLKQRTHRLERRRANVDPETQTSYNKYRGWMT